METWKKLREKLLQNKAVKKEYDRLAPRYAAISELISARTENEAYYTSTYESSRFDQQYQRHLSSPRGLLDAEICT